MMLLQSRSSFFTRWRTLASSARNTLRCSGYTRREKSISRLLSSNVSRMSLLSSGNINPSSSIWRKRFKLRRVLSKPIRLSMPRKSMISKYYWAPRAVLPSNRSTPSLLSWPRHTFQSSKNANILRTKFDFTHF
jgi:hypothetical protein